MVFYPVTLGKDILLWPWAVKKYTYTFSTYFLPGKKKVLQCLCSHKGLNFLLHFHERLMLNYRKKVFFSSSIYLPETFINETSTKGISSSKCDICTLKLILTLFVQQNYWHFWMRVGSISFVLQNSWHFQMMEEYDRIYLFVFCLSFGNSLGIFNLQSRQFA